MPSFRPPAHARLTTILLVPHPPSASPPVATSIHAAPTISAQGSSVQLSPAVLALATARQRMPGPPQQSLCHSKQSLARFRNCRTFRSPTLSHDRQKPQSSLNGTFYRFRMRGYNACIKPSLIVSSVDSTLDSITQALACCATKTHYFAPYQHSSFDVQVSHAVRKASNSPKAPQAGLAIRLSQLAHQWKQQQIPARHHTCHIASKSRKFLRIDHHLHALHPTSARQHFRSFHTLNARLYCTHPTSPHHHIIK
jgi:hypothetical protein